MTLSPTLELKNANLITMVEKRNVCDDSIANLKSDNASLIAKIDKLNKSLSSLNIENASLISKAKDLNICNASISNLKNENAILHAKIDELNVCKPSTSSVNHVSICTRCRDINVDAIHDHLALIKEQNDHIAQLTSKINEHEIENEKIKFARSMLYNGNVLALRMVLASNRETIVGAKAKTPPFARGLRRSRWSDRDKAGRDTLRSIQHFDEGLRRGLVQS
jgi:chromosome segregation ATPase